MPHLPDIESGWACPTQYVVFVPCAAFPVNLFVQVDAETPILTAESAGLIPILRETGEAYGCHGTGGYTPGVNARESGGAASDRS